MNKFVQVRYECGKLEYFSIVKEAFECADKNSLVWKISFGLPNGERVRLVRGNNLFFYENIFSEMKKEIDV